MTTERKLSKTSIFSAEILMMAPADIEVSDRSKKYRDLRRDLTNAMTNTAWGIRINLSSETLEELKHQIRNLTMAGKTWERAVKLNTTRGLSLSVHYKTDYEQLKAVIDMYFNNLHEASDE
jgi:hypothetical protein